MRPRRLAAALAILFAIGGPLAPVAVQADYDAGAELLRLIDNANVTLKKDLDISARLATDMAEVSRTFGEFNQVEDEINGIMAKCDMLDVNNRMKVILQLDVAIVTNVFMSKKQFETTVDKAVQSFLKSVGKKIVTAPVMADIKEKWPNLFKEKGFSLDVGDSVESSVQAVQQFNTALGLDLASVAKLLRRENAELAQTGRDLPGSLLILRHSQLIREAGNAAIGSLEQLKRERRTQHRNLTSLKALVDAEIDRLQRDIHSWERQLKLMGLLKEEGSGSKMPTIVTFSDTPNYDFGAAANRMREAWQHLAEGSYTCETYHAVLQDARTGASAKATEMGQPTSLAASKACDRQAPGFSIASCGRAMEVAKSTSERIMQSYDAQVGATERQLAQDAKALADGPISKFAAEVRKFNEHEVTMTVAGQMQQQKMAAQGDWLATNIWQYALNAPADIIETGFPFQYATLQILATDKSQQILREWYERVASQRNAFRGQHEGAKRAAQAVTAFAPESALLAKEAGPHQEQWDCFSREAASPITGIGSIREEFARLHRFEPGFTATSLDGEAASARLMTAADTNEGRVREIVQTLRQVPAAKTAADAYRDAMKELFAASQGQLDAGGDEVYLELASSGITEAGLKALEQRVQSLSNPITLEKEAISQLPGSPGYDPKHQVLSSERIADIKQTVRQTQARIDSARERYTEAYKAVRIQEEALGPVLEAMSKRLEPLQPDVAALFHLNALAHEYSAPDDHRALASRVGLIPPGEFVGGGLAAGKYIERYAELAERYHQSVNSLLPVLRAERYAPEMEALRKKVDENAGRLLALDGTSFSRESNKYSNEASELFLRAAAEGKIEPKRPLNVAYMAIQSRLSDISSNYYQKQRIVEKEAELRSLVASVTTFLSDPEALGGTNVARQWMESIARATHAVEDGPVRDAPAIRSLLTQLQALSGRLSETAFKVDAAILKRDTAAIQTMYAEFIAAYEGKNLPALMGCLAKGWRTADGSEASEMEETLSNSFRVFDKISFKISDLTVRPLGEVYEVSYQAALVGVIKGVQKTHTETTNVLDRVIITPDGPRILKTSGMLY